ncbi:hypothetical protein [Phormidesmis sp. 146-33]
MFHTEELQLFSQEVLVETQAVSFETEVILVETEELQLFSQEVLVKTQIVVFFAQIVGFPTEAVTLWVRFISFELEKIPP